MQRGNRAVFLYDKTERVGVYQVQWNGATQQRFAVNLLDARESNLEPRPAFRVGDSTVVAGTTPVKAAHFKEMRDGVR